MDVFKLEMYVEDKNLPKVKRAIAGLVIDMKDAPVINAAIGKNGKMQAQTSGKVEDLLRAWLTKHKLKEIDVRNIREFARSIGRGDNAASYILKQAQDAKLLRKFGKGSAMKYKVLP